MRWFFRTLDNMPHDGHRDDYLRLSKVGVQSLLVALMLLFLCIFVAGYYWGKKSAIERFMKDLDQESFADKIYTSMCSWEDSSDESKEKEEINDDSISSEGSEEGSLSYSSERHFIAQLAGFGSQKTAQAYQIRLQKKGVPAHVVERHSSTAQGKKRTWYQVVTPAMEKTIIDDIVKRLAQEDKLASVNIVEINNENEEGRAL